MTGSYSLVNNVVVIPSAAVGGAIYAVSPPTAFTAASAVGLLGLGAFVVFAAEFEGAVARRIEATAPAPLGGVTRLIK